MPSHLFGANATYSKVDSVQTFELPSETAQLETPASNLTRQLWQFRWRNYILWRKGDSCLRAPSCMGCRSRWNKIT